jgi:4-hydroxy-4-methyl-2-oxoglutarate aldolase
VVTDGGIRDALEFEEAGLPVFCRFRTPLAPKGRWSYAAIDEPVAMPGQAGDAVTIRPGDILHGDGDGLVVVPRQHLASVVADAEEVERIEKRIRQALRDGADRERAYGDNPRFGHIRKLARAD